jgi:hypothetical protein
MIQEPSLVHLFENFGQFFLWWTRKFQKGLRQRAASLLNFGIRRGFTRHGPKNGGEQALKMIEKRTFLSYKLYVG